MREAVPRRRRAAHLGSILAAVSAAALFAAAVPPALAADCATPDALGTSRVLEVDTAGGLFVGTKSYAQTLPLAPHEIVLTFDDGPLGKPTDDVLAALKAHCVEATFFIVGEQAAAHPAQLKRILAAGHTVAHHTHTHTFLNTVDFARGKGDIVKGWQTVDRILYGKAGEVPVTPFFRFPGFAPTRELSDWLKGNGVGVFDADFWGSDWTKITPEALLKQTLARIEARGSGILLLHDIHAHTAAMVPDLLRELKARGYKIVHIVPKKSNN